MKRKHTACAALAAIFASAGLASPAYADDYLQLGTGVDYSSGDYGDVASTDMLAVPFSIKLKSGNFTLRASIPYLDVNGPTGVIPGDGGVSTGGSQSPVTRRTGMGDTYLTAGYTLDLGTASYFDITGKVKLPTGSQSKFLSTGTTDYTVQGELTKGLGNTFLAVRGGRRFNGSNTMYPLQNAWLAGGGIYQVSGPVTLGLDYDWRQGSLATSPDHSEATASVTYKTSKAFLIQGYAYKGFAKGSPNIGGGVQLLYRFAL